MYGDVSGTVIDPNGNALDSAIVIAGSLSDTTDSTGTYFVDGASPWLNNSQCQAGWI